jgi:hypothetical protein
MTTNKTIPDDKLGELFREIPLDNPSPDFMGKLFLRIDNEILREKKKHQRMVAGQMAAGISGILILPALVLYLCTIFIPDFSFSIPKISLDSNLNFIVIGLSVLLLLIVDTLFRTHSANRMKHAS